MTEPRAYCATEKKRESACTRTNKSVNSNCRKKACNYGDCDHYVKRGGKRHPTLVS